MTRKPRLTVVKTTAVNPDAPPATLGKAGASLWQSIATDYEVRDAGRRATLLQICSAADRLAECVSAIERDGPVVDGKFGPREHPLLKCEMWGPDHLLATTPVFKDSFTCELNSAIACAAF